MPSPLRIPWIHRGWTPAPMIVSNIRNWERNGTDSSRDPSECFCWHCDFRLLAFRTVREQISVVLSRLGYGNFLWQPWEIDTSSYVASLSSNCHGEHSFLGVFFNFSFHSMALTWFFSYVLFLSFLSYFFDTFQISICWSVLKICHRTSLFLPILSSWLTFASSWFYIPFRCCKNLPAMVETWVGSLRWEDLLEKEMATHSSILAWEISWTEEAGRSQSMGSQRVRHDWVTNIRCW